MLHQQEATESQHQNGPIKYYHGTESSCTDKMVTLTYWGRDEMDNISQTTFSNVFSSMKMFEFRLKVYS